MVESGSPAPDATIVIRAKNEEKLLPRCLAMIGRQQTALTFEVLLIDSGSTDRTVAIAHRFDGVTVREIPPDSFNYGATLNEGVRLARGRYVVALSAHCVPVDERWFESLVQPLEADQAMAAAFSRQVPWPGCEPLERNALQKLFAESDYTLDGKSVDSDPYNTFFSNASACFRRELALAVPFQALPWAEDRVWAHAVLRAGHKIGYASRSVVRHSHQRSVRGYFRLGRVEGQIQAMLGRPVVPLRSCPWFGVRPLWRALLRWRRVCALQGVPQSRQFPLALASLARSIAYDLGRSLGQQAVRPGDGPRAMGG